MKKEDITPKIKKFFNWIWQECKDRNTLLLFIGVVAVMYLPVWGGYLLHAIFGWAWCSAVASAYLLFWAGPFTPFFPVCMGITLSIKKALQVKSQKQSEKSAADQPAEKSHRSKRGINNEDNPITYCKLFWLFLIGSVIGVMLEGLFCLISKGAWETHVVSVYLPLNPLYGTGAVLFYVGAVRLQKKNIWCRVLYMTLGATALELICGLLLRYGLGMKAWSYENSFMNYKGIICLGFSLAWGVAAFGFCKLYPYISKFLNRLKAKGWNYACLILSAVLVLDVSLAGLAITRWSGRHYGFEATTQFEQELDTEAPDEWMKSRFVEWKFIDSQ